MPHRRRGDSSAIFRHPGVSARASRTSLLKAFGYIESVEASDLAFGVDKDEMLVMPRWGLPSCAGTKPSFMLSDDLLLGFFVAGEEDPSTGDGMIAARHIV